MRNGSKEGSQTFFLEILQHTLQNISPEPSLIQFIQFRWFPNLVEARIPRRTISFSFLSFFLRFLNNQNEHNLRKEDFITLEVYE